MRVLFLMILSITMNSSYSIAGPLLRPWARHNKEHYEAGVTTHNAFRGKYSAYIRSKEGETPTVGTLWQAIKARPAWFGEKVRMTVHMKTLRVEDAAGLFMRVSTYGGWIHYDYMYDRAVQGDNDWHDHMIVLQIPHDTSLIDFGVWIVGKGEVQVDDFRFDVVDNKVRTTGTSEKIEFEQPGNLDFEGFQYISPCSNTCAESCEIYLFDRGPQIGYLQTDPKKPARASLEVEPVRGVKGWH